MQFLPSKLVESSSAHAQPEGHFVCFFPQQQKRRVEEAKVIRRREVRTLWEEEDNMKEVNSHTCHSRCFFRLGQKEFNGIEACMGLVEYNKSIGI